MHSRRALKNQHDWMHHYARAASFEQSAEALAKAQDLLIRPQFCGRVEKRERMPTRGVEHNLPVRLEQRAIRVVIIHT